MNFFQSKEIVKDQIKQTYTFSIKYINLFFIKIVAYIEIKLSNSI